MHRWKLSALAAAAFVSAALTPTDASALALGRVAVQSALGEPLRAEIEVPQATAAELEGLRAGIATPDIFKAQGMEYSSTARQVHVEVVRRPDGTAVLRLSSNSPVSDPFIDLVVDANWSAGQLVRSYTLLLDPPAAQRPAPAPTTAPQIQSAKSEAAKPASTGRTYSSDGAAPAPASAGRGDSAGDSVTVRSGDTAGRIANAQRASGVSLDQMLVAMQRSNPNAFVQGNVNRLRAGAVLKMPSREEALGTSTKEARQIVAAQSRDFNEFRRRLASKAPDAKVAAAERTASGQVQAQVQDNAAAAAPADKLTLSKGAIKGQHAAEEKLAQDKQANAQSDRMGELQRNLDELKQVAANASGTAATPAPAPVAAAGTTPAPGLPVPVTPPAAPATAPVAEAPAATAAPASTDAPSAEAAAAPSPAEAPAPVAPAAAAPKPAPVAVTPPAPAPGFLEELTGDNPLILPAAGGALALLLGLLGWRTLQRRRAQAADSSGVPDSQMASESFYDGSGGQQVDTRHSATTGGASTMAYSPSQLDAGGDVDPVAEAEVYLAYGRDVQAEEILKEALRTQPDRLGVHMKLAEIYAKRQDVKSLETSARAIQPLTNSTGPNWERVLELGRLADPGNALYQGGASAPAAPSSSPFADALAKTQGAPAGLAAGAAAAGMTAAAQSAPAAMAGRFPADLDLSLDMDLPGGLSDDPAAAMAGPASVLAPSDQDFAALEPNWGSPASMQSPAAAKPLDPSPAASQPLDLGKLDLALESAEAAAAAPAIDPGLTLDLSGLDLDLGDSPAAPVAAQTQPDDPLSTKLDLAREFHAIGDSEGARTLVEEVIAEASGEIKNRAQRLLAEID